MAIAKEHIIRKALMDAGIWTSASEAVPGDYSSPCSELLVDIVSEMNAEPAVVCEQRHDVVSVTGTVLTFKPFTEAELATISGGGTIDTTDRLTDFIPVQPPKVIGDNGVMAYLSLTDLLSTECEDAFAFRVNGDQAELLFNVAPGSVTIIRNVPIVVDTEPAGYVRVPEMYRHYLTTKLTEAVALRYQQHDVATLMQQRSLAMGQALANQATANRPVKSNMANALNRFRRYS